MAGGSLITKIRKAFKELVTLGLVADKPVKFFGAQATGCSPISTAVKVGADGIEPQRPNTIARSLAIGNPADGAYAIRAIRDSGGWAEDVSDVEIVSAIQELAETEGVFTETAGGVTTAVTARLYAHGRIHPDELTVSCITGNGLKTTDVLQGRLRTGNCRSPAHDRVRRIFGRAGEPDCWLESHRSSQWPLKFVLPNAFQKHTNNVREIESTAANLPELVTEMEVTLPRASPTSARRRWTGAQVHQLLCERRRHPLPWQR
jgi:threonine synthase